MWEKRKSEEFESKRDREGRVETGTLEVHGNVRCNHESALRSSKLTRRCTRKPIIVGLDSAMKFQRWVEYASKSLINGPGFSTATSWKL